MTRIDAVFAADRERPPHERTLPWQDVKNGVAVIVEPKPPWANDMRVFRPDVREYCAYSDWAAHGSRARFYAHIAMSGEDLMREAHNRIAEKLSASPQQDHLQQGQTVRHRVSGATGEIVAVKDHVIVADVPGRGLVQDAREKWARTAPEVDDEATKVASLASAKGTIFDWSKFSLLVAKAVGEQPDAWQFEISGLAVDGSVTPIARCPTLVNGVRVAHELSSISGKPCVTKHPDLGSILPSDPPLTSDEAANDWIDAAIVKQECKRLFNCRALGLEPDWTCFTHLEIDGRTSRAGESTIHSLDDEAADYWVVQGRDFNGDAEDIADCRSLADAIRAGQDLANKSGLVCMHPHLGQIEPGEPAMTELEAEDWIVTRKAGHVNDGPSF